MPEWVVAEAGVDNMAVQIPFNYMKMFSELVQEQQLNIDYFY